MSSLLRSNDASLFMRLAAGIAAAGIAWPGPMTAHAQVVPTDASPTCTVPVSGPGSFPSWFQSGSAAVNGVVNPANSVAFANSPNCSFYQWAEQMFFWATSPAPEIYGGGGRIFDSATFFDVSTVSGGSRTLLPHTPGFIHFLGVRAAQLGPDGLPVIFDKAGDMLQVERPQTIASAELTIPDKLGNRVKIAHAERAANGAVVLRDASGAIVEPRTAAPQGRAIFRAPLSGPIKVQEFVVDNLPIFIDPFGNVVEVEQGQADGSVLEAQKGSLIYYAIFVNDVYAYFLTGLKDNQIESGNPNPVFPTSMSDLNAITTFASGHSVSFLDPDALAVELKTSWVDASTLPNPSSYITISATVPTYNTSSNTTWTQTGQKTLQLALVGMHVVGSTAGHPEMIWATFEHVGNTPDATYQYVSNGGTLKTVSQTTAGTWLFTASNAAGPFNQTHMSQSGSNITALSPFTISPSDTIRWKAWGAASNLSPNPIDGTAAASNTEIIAINSSILSQMPSGDVRTNYILKGATWTIGGFAPDPGQPTLTNPGNQVGTSLLSNTTMETYQQGVDNTATGGSNCFSCHSSSNATIATTAVSHVFGAIKPLF